MWGASARRRHCAASHRIRGASNRNASAGFLEEVIHQAGEGIEADDARAVGDEIGEGVHVVVVELAVAIINDGFQAADFDLRGAEDFFGVRDYFLRWRKPFHAQAGLCAFDDAGGFNFGAVGGFADVHGAEVEGFARGKNFYAVEIFVAESFDAGDVAAARGDEFLDDAGGIEAELDSVAIDGGGELLRRIEADDADAAAADIGFHDNRETKIFCRGYCLRGMVDYHRTRMRQAERFE